MNIKKKKALLFLALSIIVVIVNSCLINAFLFSKNQEMADNFWMELFERTTVIQNDIEQLISNKKINNNEMSILACRFSDLDGIYRAYAKYLFPQDNDIVNNAWKNTTINLLFKFPNNPDDKLLDTEIQYLNTIYKYNTELLSEITVDSFENNYKCPITISEFKNVVEQYQVKLKSLNFK